MSPTRLHIIDWLPFDKKNAKRQDVWKGGTMSHYLKKGGTMYIAHRSTLISTSLNDSLICHMSIYLVVKTVLSRLGKIRRTFFKQGGGTKRKYHLVRWTKFVRVKRKGWKLEKENSLRQEIISYKYIKEGSISTMKHKLDDSHIWADLLKVKEIICKSDQF